jgi:uncharacterized protein YutE (UPF0331/DUF86 family)
VTPDLARRLAPISGLRKVLAHEYLGVDWDEVIRSLSDLPDLHLFGSQVRAWLRARDTSSPERQGGAQALPDDL